MKCSKCGANIEITKFEDGTILICQACLCKNEINAPMKCPNCNNIRIVKAGLFYHCVSGHDEKYQYHSGCGFVGIEEDFKVIKVKKLNFK